MKNHIRQDKKLLQANKKWSHLKNSQKTWILEMIQIEHAMYVQEHGCLPIKKHKDIIACKVYERVEEREIWIPYGEFHIHVFKAIDRINRKSPLFIAPPKKKSEKEQIPKANFEEFPTEVQEDIKLSLLKGIKRFIDQTNRIPPNNVRDSEIKQILRGFNSKKMAQIWYAHAKKSFFAGNLP